MKLDIIQVSLHEALINSYISHDELVSVNNVLREYKLEIKKKKNFLNFRGTHYINMIDISRRTYKRNGIEIIVDNNEILWLNKKQIEKVSAHNILR